MNEINILVKIDDEETVFTFSKFPILIGRSPECNLCLCHEVIARELCLLWPEKNSDKIRIEAKPALTNNIMHENQPLLGGLSATELKFNVGPVNFFATTKKIEKKTTKKQNKKALLLIIASLVAVIFLAIATFDNLVETPKQESALSSVPFDLEFTTPESKAETSTKAAEVLAQRANELQARRPYKPQNVIEAIHLLQNASIATDSAEKKQAYEKQLESLKAQIQNEYKSARLQLVLAFRNKNKSDIKKAAKQILPYLVDTSHEQKLWLINLAGD
jgi:hypothetical protein